MEEKIAELMAAAARINALTTAIHGAALIGLVMTETRVLLYNSCSDFNRLAAELIGPVEAGRPPSPETVPEAQV